MKKNLYVLFYSFSICYITFLLTCYIKELDIRTLKSEIVELQEKIEIDEAEEEDKVIVVEEIEIDN